MEQELDPEMQNELGNVMTAASDALHEILDRIDTMDAAPPASSATLTDVVTGPDQVTLNSQDVQEEPVVETGMNQEPNITKHELPNNSGDTSLQPLELLSLPHEGERWARLRNQMMGLTHFKEYLRRTEEEPYWSIDEAFASFCLDRIEETLTPAIAKPSKLTQAKTGTRRKGQPKKYERRQTAPIVDNPLRPSRKRRGRENGLKLDDEEESFLEDREDKDEDILAMDDNPDDLDYHPVPIIRYPKRRRSLPRSINNTQVSPKPPARSKKTIKIAEPPKKKPAPKKAAKIPKKMLKRESFGAPRKRGRPKKVVTEGQKKFPKPRVKAEKPAKQYIRMEVRLQRLPKMYECKTCFEQFPEAEDIKKHFLGVHQRDRMLVPTQESSNENIGVNPTHGGLDTECPLLLDVANLANLLRQCPKCKKFVDNMTVHKREHRERNFICEECGKGFTENQILQKHKKVHEMDRTGDRYKCELCDKSYRFSQNLRSHMMYHGGEKTFICDHCGKSFYTNNRLIIHSAIHMKEKPYKCSECGRGFSQKSNMQKHERVHTGVKPYQCDLCKESFNHKVSLKNHKKKHHGIDWWKDAGRPKPITTKKSKDAPQLQGVIVSREEQIVDQVKQNAMVHLEKEQPVLENQWKGGDVSLQRENNAGNQWRDNSHDRQPVREIEPAESPWHRQENEIVIEHQNQAAEEAVRLQTLHQAGSQWKGSNVPMDRQAQAGDQGMAAFFYPSAYLQAYPSGYSGMPVIPINTDTSIHPSTRPTY